MLAGGCRHPATHAKEPLQMVPVLRSPSVPAETILVVQSVLALLAMSKASIVCLIV